MILRISIEGTADITEIKGMFEILEAFQAAHPTIKIYVKVK